MAGTDSGNDGAGGRVQARPDDVADDFDGALLDSQFAALEPPGADEDTLELDVSAPPDALVDAILRWRDRAG